VAVFSPPYSEGIGHDSGDRASTKFKERLEMQQRYTRSMKSEGNIGNLKYGKGVDAIVTSPPYAEQKKGKADPEKMAERWEKHQKKDWNSWGKSAHTPGRLRAFKAMGSGYSESKNNIGNLPHGQIDAIVSSPPYSESMSKKRKGYTTHPELSKTRHMGEDSSDENIGNLPHGQVDAIVTSPPYEGSLEGTTRHTRGGIASRDRKLAQTGSITVLSEDTKR